MPVDVVSSVKLMLNPLMIGPRISAGHLIQITSLSIYAKVKAGKFVTYQLEPFAWCKLSRSDVMVFCHVRINCYSVLGRHEVLSTYRKEKCNGQKRKAYGNFPNSPPRSDIGFTSLH